MAVKPLDMATFQGKVNNMYEAIIISAKRARQIHSDTRLEFNRRAEELNALSNINTEVEDDPETPPNPDQSKLSLEFEGRPKPTETALQELSEGKIPWKYKNDEEEKPEAE